MTFLDLNGNTAFGAWLKFNKDMGRVHDHFMENCSSYVVLYQRTGLSPVFMVAFVLDQGGDLAADMRRLPIFRACLADLKVLAHLEPEKMGPVHWALLRHCCQKTSAIIAAAIAGDQVGLLADKLDYSMNPSCVSIMLKIYFRALVLGNEEDALNYSNDLLERLVA